MTHGYRIPLAFFLFVSFPALASAQAIPADYQRAMSLRDKYQPLALGIVDQVTWIEKTDRFSS